MCNSLDGGAINSLRISKATGWQSAWFFASTIYRASPALVVWRLVRLPVVLSTQ